MQGTGLILIAMLKFGHFDIQRDFERRPTRNSGYDAPVNAAVEGQRQAVRCYPGLNRFSHRIPGGERADWYEDFQPAAIDD